MFFREQRPDRRRGNRRRIDFGAARPAAEGLESRQLMAYSPLGYSLPQLNVTGFAAPSAAYGGTLAVDVRVENLGASSLIEPTQLAPGSPSFADSTPTTVQIYGSTSPSGKGGYVLLGSVDIPAVRQNSDYETVAPVILPSRPAGFPKAGNLYLTLAVNNDGSILQSSTAGNIYRIPKPVRIVTDALPNVQVVAVDIPNTLQPGDVIAPTIRIENFGVGDTGAQGSFTVALVASLDRKFGVGDAVVGSFTVTDLPGISAVPTQTTVSAIQNLFQTPNEYTVTLPALKLPTTPGRYYLGVKIDPTHQINQTYGPNNALSNLVQVGPASTTLSPASVQLEAVAPVFPNLPVNFVNTTGTTGTPIITPVATVASGQLVALSLESPRAAARARAHRHK